MLKAFLRNLKERLLASRNNEVDDDSVGEVYRNPYGVFVGEQSKKTPIEVDLTVTTHRFIKGVLLTVLQGERRIFSEFISYSGEPLDDDGEEEGWVVE